MYKKDFASYKMYGVFMIIYYNNNELQKAKDTIYSLKHEDPDSSYIKTEKVQEILKK